MSLERAKINIIDRITADGPTMFGDPILSSLDADSTFKIHTLLDLMYAALGMLHIECKTKRSTLVSMFASLHRNGIIASPVQLTYSELQSMIKLGFRYAQSNHLTDIRGSELGTRLLVMTPKIKLIAITSVLDLIFVLIVVLDSTSRLKNTIQRPNNGITVSLIILARIGAFGILLNMFLILIQAIDVSRYLYRIGRLMRSSVPDRLSYILDSGNQKFMHYLYAYKICAYSVLHVVAHMLNIDHVIHRCKDGCQTEDVPIVKSSNTTTVISWTYFLKHGSFCTGIVLTVLFVAFLTFSVASKKYNRPYVFAWMHRVMSLTVFLLTIVHGYKHLLGMNYSYIIILPFLLWFIYERRLEYLSCLSCTPNKLLHTLKINNWDLSKPGLITLWLQDARRNRDTSLVSQIDHNTHHLETSCAIYVNHPDISKYEWHPFTVSTGYTSQDRVLYIKQVGKWTDNINQMLIGGGGIGERSYLRYGRYELSSFRYYKNYKKRIFICSNLGITAYISMMRDMNNTIANRESTYFIWSVNDLSIVNMVARVLNEININTKSKHIKMYIYFSNKTNINLLPHISLERSAMHMLQCVMHNYFGFDIIANCKIPNAIILGRFNPEQLYSSLINKEKPNSLIGVFVCGSTKYCEIIHKLNKVYSNNDKRIVFDLWTDEGLN